MNKCAYFFIITLLFLLPVALFAQTAQEEHSIGFVDGSVWYSKTDLVSGEKIDVFTFIFNRGPEKISGNVDFYNKGILIGTVPFELNGHSAQQVSIPWTVPAGRHSVFVEISNVVKKSESGDVPAEISEEDGRSVGDVLVIAESPEEEEQKAKNSFFLSGQDEQYIETTFADILYKVLGKELYLDTENNTTISQTTDPNTDDTSENKEDRYVEDSRAVQEVLDDYRATKASVFVEKKQEYKEELDSVRSEQKARNTSSSDSTNTKESEDVGTATKIGKKIDDFRSKNDSSEKEEVTEVKSESKRTEYEKELSAHNALTTAKYLGASFLSVFFGSRIVFYVLSVIVVLFGLRMLWKLIRRRNNHYDDYDYDYDE